GIATSKVHIFVYSALFALPVAALTLSGHSGYVFMGIMLALTAYWLWLGVQGFKNGTDDARWARKMFGHSLIIIMGLSIMLSLDAWLP
ncbi:MAG: protoheme farnesyltransferase, partial [Candidatus Saccharibacteria bacterium]|nr:protoheme farnesyltransferase [Candidatus Saccharibacteria bacterium]